MNPNVLAGLVNRVYSDFNMLGFDNRLKLQKFVYLLQEYGVNLGYSFSLYLRGPYSPEVAKDGFQVEDFSTMPQIKPANVDIENRFSEFARRFRPHRNETEWLEAASSLVIFRRMYESESRPSIVRRVERKNEMFRGRSGFIDEVWDELVGWGLLDAR